MLFRLHRLFPPKYRVKVSISISTSTRFLSSKSSLETLILSQYNHHKFYHIVESTISTPQFLLSAAQNIYSRANPNETSPDLDAIADRISNWIQIRDLSTSIRNGNFDVESNCVKLVASRRKGDSLILPNLELKIVIEAVRIAFEIVYEKRFATFNYGGRIDIGRHTAVRYLKTTVKNPKWWFRVTFRRQPFDHDHVSRLTTAIEEKIEDHNLIRLVESLFRSKAIKFEIGGDCKGKGFPQESDLNSILINVYFHRLDREIQEIRAEIHKKNPRMDDSRVLHKPIRVYAVRYLDEILLVSSGSKLFTMNVKDRILKFIEEELGLKVDNLKSSIHSAVSEKIDFMGFELQAVPPSVLHPPISEKAMRAKKMHLKRKATKSLELKNARETIRKKLGMKIWNHVFKKLKRCGRFKFDFTIESEVREIFRKWGDEVVAEFFKSRDDCRSWQRLFSSGDFLSLKRIRDQLPKDLVDSYDEFREEVNKYMMPMNNTNKILEDDDTQEEEEEERDYAKRTVKDLTELCMRVNAPIELVRKAVKLAKFTNSMGRPRPIKLLLCLDDDDIVKWYAGVARRWLDFFCCCRNLKMVKTIVNYHLRFSCFLTLAEKHECTKRQAIQHYTKDLKVKDENGVDEVYFPTEREIRMMGDRDLSDPMPVDGPLCLILVRLAYNEPSCSCLAHFCGRADTMLYRIRLLQNRLNVDPLNENNWVPGMGAIHESLNKKCLPLCSKHSSDLLMGRINLQDIDCTSFFDVDE